MGRSSLVAVEERIRKVEELMKKGVTDAKEIAKLLGVCPDTIYRDMRIIREKMRKEFEKEDWVSRLKVILDNFDFHYRKLRENLKKLEEMEKEAKNNETRRRIIKTQNETIQQMTELRLAMLKFLQMIGILEKGNETNVEVNVFQVNWRVMNNVLEKIQVYYGEEDKKKIEEAIKEVVG